MAPKKTSSSQSNTLGSGFPSSKASASAAPSQKATKKASAKPKGDHDGDLQLDGYPELYREAKSKMGKPSEKIFHFNENLGQNAQAHPQRTMDRA